MKGEKSMKKQQKRLAAVLLSSLMLLLTACSGQAADDAKSNNNSSQPAKNQILNLVEGSDLTTLNPQGELDALAFKAMTNIYEGLYRMGPKDTPVPGIAQSYEVSKDGLTYTFHLRNASWSNGAPVTADDFVYAWKKGVNPNTLAPYSYLMTDIKNAQKIIDKKANVDTLGVEAVDKHTFKVTLERPVPYFLSLITSATFFPQNQKFVESKGDQYALDADKLLFNGPFIIKSWNHGQGWVFAKNLNYWDKKTVKLKKINVKIAQDPSTTVNLYETGKIDFLSLPSEFADQYTDSSELSKSLKSEIFYLRFNLNHPYLSNVNIRRAIDLGWNKKGITSLNNNVSVPAYFVVPKGFVKGPDGKDFRAKYPELDKGTIKEAQKYWAKGLKELGVDNVKLELLSYDSRTTITDYVKNQLEKNLPGLTLTINRQPSEQKLALERKQKYDIDFGGWGPDYQDPLTFLELFATSSGITDYRSPEYNRLIRTARTDFSNIEERWRDMQEAERVLIEKDVVISPMYQNGALQLTKPYVKGLAIHPVGETDYKWAYLTQK
jgi:oligopeptide transport system substrate-binding protein